MRPLIHTTLLAPLAVLAIVSLSCWDPPTYPLNGIHDAASEWYSPPGPTQFSCIVPTDTLVVLQWQDQSQNESGFLLERKTVPGGEYSTIARLPPNTVTYSDTFHFVIDQLYYYRVSSLSAKGISLERPEAAARVRFTPPTGLGCFSRDPTRTEIAWVTYSPGQIRVERRTGTGNYAVKAELPFGTTRYVDSTVSTLESYTYRLSSFTPRNQSPTVTVAARFFCSASLGPSFSMQKPMVAFFSSSDNEVLVTVDSSGSAWVWNSTAMAQTDQFTIQGVSLGNGAIDPSKQLMAFSARNDSAFYLIRASDHTVLRRIGVASPAGNCCFAISNGSLVLATVSGSPDIEVWNAQAGNRISVLKGHTSLPISLAASPDAATLASGGDNTIRFWNMASLTQIKAIAGGPFLPVLDFKANGDVFGAVPVGGTVVVRNFARDSTLWTRAGTVNGVCGNVLYPYFCFAENGGTSVHDRRTGAELLRLSDAGRDHWRVSFLNDGASLVVGCSDGSIRFYAISLYWTRW